MFDWIYENSVQISFLFKQQTQTNQLDASILNQWMRFLQQQADDSYQLLRKQPVPGYSVSFLITNQHIHVHSTSRSSWKNSAKKKNNSNNGNHSNSNSNSNSDNEKVYKQKVQRMILHFCSQMDKECRDIKIQVNAEARYITTEFLKAFRV